MKKFTLNLIGLFTLGLITSGCSFNERFVKVAYKSLPKTVMIYVKTIVKQVTFTITSDGVTIEESTKTVHVTGSGVFVSPNGHVLTCNHVVTYGDVQDITVCAYNSDCEKVELLYTDATKDLALLKYDVDKPIDYAELVTPGTLKVGQEVIAIGNPIWLDWTVTHGIISALNRDQIHYDMDQSDTSINPGNSGGPLFNLDGYLVGINANIIPPVNAPIFTGLGFSISPNEINKFLTKFKGLGKATVRYTGFWRGFLEGLGFNN